MVMLRKLPLLVAGLLAQSTLTPAQNAPLARKVFSSDSIEASLPTLSPDEKWVVFAQSLTVQDTRVLIQPLNGGQPRELFAAKGSHRGFTFTNSGDHLVFKSTLPGRDPNDNNYYLVRAPFDSRTGTLTGPPRQVSLDAVADGFFMFAIAPDGQSVAYVRNRSNSIMLIPTSGGTARMLVEPSPYATSALVWSADGRFLSYLLWDAQGYARMRVSRDGGSPVFASRSREHPGIESPDGKYSFQTFWNANSSSTGRLFGLNGQLLGEVKLPPNLSPVARFVANGKYIIGSATDAVSPLKVVAMSGGQSRQLSTNWARGDWSENGDVEVWTPEEGYMTLTLLSPEGERKSHARLPDDLDYRTVVGIRGEFVIYRYSRTDVGYPQNLAQFRALNLKDGTRGELSADDVWVVCCDPGASKRMSIEPSGSELYYSRVVGNRTQMRATRVGGESRLIGETPVGTVGYFAPVQNRGVYREIIKDSVRLQLIAGAGRPPKTLATFSRTNQPGGFAWTRDGSHLAVISASPKTLAVYRFDAEGALLGSQTFPLPFEAFFGISWLPDGSGLIGIAQRRAGAVTEVALVKLADPQHPILLAQNDPGMKAGLSLSPDGKHVVYNAEEKRGSSIYLIDVAEMLKQVRARK
jgi:Tol biopolymer transport system component